MFSEVSGIFDASSCPIFFFLHFFTFHVDKIYLTFFVCFTVVFVLFFFCFRENYRNISNGSVNSQISPKMLRYVGLKCGPVSPPNYKATVKKKIKKKSKTTVVMRKNMQHQIQQHQI